MSSVYSGGTEFVVTIKIAGRAVSRRASER